MRHLDDEELVMHVYGDEADAATPKAHLAACPSCRSRLDGLRRDLEALSAVDVPERGDDYGMQVWRRIQPQVQEMAGERTRAGWLPAWMAWPRLALAGGVAVLVVAAFVAGRYTRPAAGPGTTPVTASTQATPEAAPQVVKERILLVAVGDHLERSRVILAEIVNGPGASAADLASERAVAGDLVAANRLYRRTALESGNPAMASALEELERFLVEIANAPDTMSAGDVGQLRERITSQGLIFKVTVLGSRVRQRQQEAAAALAPRTKSST